MRSVTGYERAIRGNYWVTNLDNWVYVDSVL